ncbi:hypothetical protein [Marinigracilibium pacificum]|uniref:Outer membrane protein beta-barrel domain-containing protein n=1 Tax=Marinigracilibium pacificum TaxID=2729599 RepID=A0A848IUY1_9BACT|nr:hypothetical protein [Marinigracilibium pacificum]NMM47496.1 hypothetical protein [Marinigracilibium pacificum]
MLKTIQKAILLMTLGLSFFISDAQVQFSAGLTYAKSIVKSPELKSDYGVGFATGVAYRETYKSFTFTGGLNFSNRNYTIENPLLERKNYNDQYILFPILVGYNITDFLAVNGGFEFGYVIYSDFNEREYKDFTSAFLFGIEFLQNKTVSPFIRASYSPSGRLNYELFDDYGNSIGTTSDFKNFYILTGINVYLHGK